MIERSLYQARAHEHQGKNQQAEQAVGQRNAHAAQLEAVEHVLQPEQGIAPVQTPEHLQAQESRNDDNALERGDQPETQHLRAVLRQGEMPLKIKP